jgi:hypothetical protein
LMPAPLAQCTLLDIEGERLRGATRQPQARFSGSNSTVSRFAQRQVPPTFSDIAQTAGVTSR